MRGLPHGDPRLPPLWHGARRRYLVLLTAVGLAQAVLAGAAAHFLARALHRGSGATIVVLSCLLGVAAIVVGLMRVAERVLAEKLSQDYVHDVRMGLLRRMIADGSVRSLGVAVTRTSNDLTAIKNWVALGVASLAVGVPLLLGTAGALAFLNPILAIGLLVPVALFISAMAALTGPTFARSCRVRTVRGRLSGHIGDAALGIQAIRSGGGAERELGRVDRLSRELVAAQVERARFAGLMRGASAAGTGLATAGVVMASVSATVPPSTVAAAISLVGFAATPVNELGRVAEYRQAYRAARRIIAPAAFTTPPPQPKQLTAAGRAASGHASHGLVIASDLRLPDGATLPALVAGPGDRVHVDIGDRYVESALLHQFVGLTAREPGQVIVSGRDLALVSDRQHRRLVGYAAQGALLPRGSIMRSVKYRVPTTPDEEAFALLDRIGLTRRLTELPKGEQTILIHGGTPLGISDRARLNIARAMIGNPPVLVLDRVDSDLGTAARSGLRHLLADYPGVILIASDEPEAIFDNLRKWNRYTPADPDPTDTKTSNIEACIQQSRSSNSS